MDSDFWTSHLAAAAKRQFTLHHHQISQLDGLNIDDFEADDEVRPDFPCPYCYEDFDIASLCSHLEMTTRASPKSPLRRVAIPNSRALSLLGKDLREAHLQVLLGDSGYRSSNANSSNAVTDPFLSSLILNFPAFESKDISKSLLSNVEENSVNSVTSSHIWKASFDPSLSYEEREERMRQAARRVFFLQDLLASSLLGE
ncbi:protein DEHYDRATION-INDUCED 19 homolog 4-like isoform X1 [Camellia sinensis]|uniref:protein DEHYDRATION-INDUCED 19 homolog 4-like isoform X1 n=1 Tax=Camellia sinensis TaxID=4442 RepID=UPI001036002D|nr:protein DEHYDRATION-INDUCED 19 homolog 4-like isoform X1 [Camellia sinensis]